MLARSRSLRPKRKRRRLRAGAVGLLALLMVLGGGVALYLRSSLPQTSGRLVVPGLHAEIRIDRDTDGVSLITARVPAAALLTRAVAAGRQPRLGQADGRAARRQLPRRAAARPDGPNDPAGRSRHPLPGISKGCADDAIRNA